MPDEQLNSSAISQVKKRFVFKSKTFPKNDEITQKHSNVQDNCDVTKQSLSSTLSIIVRGCLRTFSSAESFQLKLFSSSVSVLWPTRQYPNSALQDILGMLEVNNFVKCDTKSKLTA